MGQVHHGSATTTATIRRAIQHSQASLRQLTTRYGINQKTVAKWKKRTSTADLRTGPKEPKSTVLSGEEEAIIVAFRRHTLLPRHDGRLAADDDVDQERRLDEARQAFQLLDAYVAMHTGPSRRTGPGQGQTVSAKLDH